MTPEWIPLHNPFLPARSARKQGRDSLCYSSFHSADSVLPPSPAIGNQGSQGR